MTQRPTPAGLAETRRTLNSPGPPKTEYFGEFRRRAPAAGIVVSGCQFNSSGQFHRAEKPSRIHHLAAGRAEGGEGCKPNGGNELSRMERINGETRGETACVVLIAGMQRHRGVRLQQNECVGGAGNISRHGGWKPPLRSPIQTLLK